MTWSSRMTVWEPLGCHIRIDTFLKTTNPLPSNLGQSWAKRKRINQCQLLSRENHAKEHYDNVRLKENKVRRWICGFHQVVHMSNEVVVSPTFSDEQGFQSRVWGVGVKVQILRPSKNPYPWQGYRGLGIWLLPKLLYHFCRVCQIYVLFCLLWVLQYLFCITNDILVCIFIRYYINSDVHIMFSVGCNTARK